MPDAGILPRYGSISNLDPRIAARRRLAWATAAFAAFAWYGSLVPLDFQPRSWASAWEGFLRMPLSTFAQDRADWATNILLFIPLGFCGLGALTADGRPRRAALLAAPVIAACLLYSLVIEFSQSWFPTRTPSWNDVIAETLGAAAGTVGWIILGESVVVWLNELFSGAGGTRPFRLLQAYVVGVLLYAVVPLDLTISVSEIYHKFRDGRIAIVPFAVPDAGLLAAAGDWLWNCLVFVPVGVWAATRPEEGGLGRRRWLQTLFRALAVAAAVEAAQVLVVSRYADVTDVATGTAGAAVGATLWRRYGLAAGGSADMARQTGATRWGWLAAAAALAWLASDFWRPFDFQIDPDLMRRKYAGFFTAPLAPLYQGSTLNAVGDVLRKLLGFAALGGALYAALGATPLGRQSRLALVGATVVAAGWGLAIELGQFFLPPRTPHVSDVILYGLGGLLGAVVAVAIVPRLER